MVPNFKNSLKFEERLAKANALVKKYPDRVPIICQKTNGRDNPDIDKNKYLVPITMTIGQFLLVIRQRINIKPEEAIFLFVNNFIVPSNELVGTVY